MSHQYFGADVSQKKKIAKAACMSLLKVKFVRFWEFAQIYIKESKFIDAE